MKYFVLVDFVGIGTTFDLFPLIYVNSKDFRETNSFKEVPLPLFFMILS
jgi:hypothetical protein